MIYSKGDVVYHKATGNKLVIISQLPDADSNDYEVAKKAGKRRKVVEHELTTDKPRDYMDHIQ